MNISAIFNYEKNAAETISNNGVSTYTAGATATGCGLNSQQLLVQPNEPHDYYHNYNKDIDKWFMMQSPWPVIGLAAFYLIFVLKLGPNFMSNKKAYSLKPVMLFYNFLQVIFSSWWSLKALLTISKMKTLNFLDIACRPQIVEPEITYEMDSMAWYYLMSKYIELLDTVFFVLRRKQSQVTFLHVYHHTNMAVSTWAFTKFVKGIQTMPIGICNTFIHVLMYGYYLLAALGPKVHKYLWWKKYITSAQITQFLIILIYLGLLLSSGCSIPNAFIIFAVCNTASFLLLFYKFYTSSYNRKKSQDNLMIINDQNMAGDKNENEKKQLKINTEDDIITTKKKNNNNNFIDVNVMSPRRNLELNNDNIEDRFMLDNKKKIKLQASNNNNLLTEQVEVNDGKVKQL